MYVYCSFFTHSSVKGRLGCFQVLIIVNSAAMNIRFSQSVSSVAQSYPIICDPCSMQQGLCCSTPGFPVRHQLLEPSKIHVHWVGDAIQPSHPLSSPSQPTFNLSQHQGLFQWISSFHQAAKVLEFQLQHKSFNQDWLPLALTDWMSLVSKGLSRVFSNATVQKHQFFGAQLPL